jgi:DNA-binding winged helix-turn-helix (wHTH) protein
MRNPQIMTYRFGPFQLNVRERSLHRDGEQVPLPPKAFDTLVALVQNCNRLLSKDELMDRIWAGQAVEEGNLSWNISTLRKALNGGADQQDYIQTVPKGGYRFVADVQIATLAHDVIDRIGVSSTTPKAFISYSWSSRQHQNWVKSLAERLTSDGVDVILDLWMLKEGQDKYAFMEQMVTDESVSKVLTICDKQYAEKANSRKGGVGTESQIISKEIYEKVDQNKFVAIVTEYDKGGSAHVPAFLSSRIFIDMCTEEKALENYEQLLRFIFDRPLHVKPAIGTAPAYLFEDAGAASHTSPKLAMLKRAVLEDRSSVPGLITEFLDSYSAALEDYRIEGTVTSDYDEKVISSIEKFTPYRDEFIDFITFIASYRDDERTYQLIFEFFEGLLRYNHPPKDSGSWNELWFDNYRFIVFELFLYQMTALVKNQRYEQANIFLTQAYFDSYLADRGRGTLLPYYVFDKYPESLERMRKQRLKINLYYVTADLLRKRAYRKELNFESLMQTDFILFLRSALNPHDEFSGYWQPRTAGYAEFHGVFEIFAKAASKKIFKNLMILLNVESKQDFETKLKTAIESGRIHRRESFRSIYIERLINLDHLDTYQ